MNAGHFSLLLSVPESLRPAVAALWNASWQSCLVVVAVWILCRLFPKLPPAIRCSLWRLTLAKFLIALVFITPAVLPLLPSREPAAPRAVSPMSDRPATVAGAMPRFHSGDRSTTRVPVAARQSNSVSREPDIARRESVDPQLLTMMPSSAGAQGSLPASPGSIPYAFWPWALLLCYGVGVTVGIAFLTVQGVRTALWRSRACTPNTDPDVQVEIEHLGSRLNVRQLPRLLTAPDISLPLLIGLTRPAIVLPTADRWEVYSPEQRRLMLGHELAHLRRRDLLWMWLPAVVRILFFFDPFAWLAQRAEDLARETACDALAIRAADATVAGYGALLLAVAASWRRPSAPIAGLGIASDRVASLRLRLLALQRATHLSPVRLRLLSGTIALSLPLAFIPWRIVAASPPDRKVASVPKSQYASLTLTVIGPDGKPVSGFIVSRLRNGIPGLRLSNKAFRLFPNDRMLTDSNGTVHFTAVPRGEGLRLWIDDDRFLQPQLVPVTDEADQQQTIRLEPAAMIHGRLTDGKTGRGITKATIWAQTSEDHGPIDGVYVPNVVSQATTDKRGFYTLQGLPARAFVLNVFAYQRTIPLGRTHVAVQSGQLVSGYDFRCMPGVLVTGQVTDATSRRGVGNELVQVVASDDSSSPDSPHWSSAGSTDAQGRYRLVALPGHVKLRLQSWGYRVSAKNPEPAYEHRLDVRAGTPATSNFTVSGTLAVHSKREGDTLNLPISGHVVGPDGQPVAEANVVLSRDDHATDGLYIQITDKSGYFNIRNVPHGWPQEYVHLHAVASGIASRSLDIWPDSGGTYTLKLDPRESPTLVSALHVLPTPSMAVH